MLCGPWRALQDRYIDCPSGHDPEDREATARQDSGAFAIRGLLFSAFLSPVNPGPSNPCGHRSKVGTLRSPSEECARACNRPAPMVALALAAVAHGRSPARREGAVVPSLAWGQSGPR